MIRPLALFFFSIFLTLSVVFGQRTTNDTLNKTNSKGEKQGYWIEYLNKYLKPVDSRAKACYYIYRLYDNGKPMTNFQDNSSFKIRTSLNEVCNEGSPIPLNGIYTWGEDDSVLIFENSFKDGHFLYIKEFHFARPNYNPSGLDWIHYDSLYKNIPGTHLFETYKSYNRKDFFLSKRKYYYKKKKRWKYYKI